MRTFLFALSLTFVFGPSGTGLAEPPAAKRPLTFQQARSGRGIVQSVTRWRWRPGHAELVRVTTQARGKERKRVLLAMDAETGTERTLFELSTLDEKVAKKPGRVRGMGRSGAKSLTWTQDGKAFCALVKGHLVWVDLAADTARTLTSFPVNEPISDVRVAPSGSGVAFCKDYEQWVVPTKAGDPYPLTTGGSEVMRNAGLDWVYPEELGHSTGTWWAHDGSALAVLQLDQTNVPEFSVPRVLPLHAKARTMRYPKAGDPNPKPALRVLPVEGQGDGVAVDLGDAEYLARVAWVPDNKRLLAVTLDRDQRHARVLLCDAATGRSKLLFEERDAAWLDVPRAPHFVNDQDFLWFSQMTRPLGQWQLRSVSEEPRDVLALSGGTVQSAGRPSLDLKAGHALANVRTYPRSESVVDVDTATGRQKAWRPGEVGEATSVRATWNDAATHALVTWSSPARPSRTALFRKDGTKVRDIGDGKGAGFDQVAWATFEDGSVSIPDVDPKTVGVVHWRLWKPAAFDPDKQHPLIVHTYGGPNARMIRPSWSRGALWISYLTQLGYLVAQIDGRGSGGQSRAFTRLVNGCLGRCEMDDQARAVQELAKRPYVDGTRVGIYGWSYGGTMACNGVIFRGDVFKAAVAVAPVTDWRLYDTIYTERFMGRPQDNTKGYDHASTVKAAKDLDGHLLLIHGLADDNVHAQNTYRLVEALLKAKKTTFDVMTYPDRGHGIGGPAHSDVFRRLLAWFDEHLDP